MRLVSPAVFPQSERKTASEMRKLQQHVRCWKIVDPAGFPQVETMTSALPREEPSGERRGVGTTVACSAENGSC
jgi:hypothetical protein